MGANPELFEKLPMEPEAVSLLKARKITAMEAVGVSVAISIKRFADTIERSAPPIKDKV